MAARRSAISAVSFWQVTRSMCGLSSENPVDVHGRIPAPLDLDLDLDSETLVDRLYEHRCRTPRLRWSIGQCLQSETPSRRGVDS